MRCQIDPLAVTVIMTLEGEQPAEIRVEREGCPGGAPIDPEPRQDTVRLCQAVKSRLRLDGGGMEYASDPLPQQQPLSRDRRTRALPFETGGFLELSTDD